MLYIYGCHKLKLKSELQVSGKVEEYNSLVLRREGRRGLLMRQTCSLAETQSELLSDW